MAQDSGNMRSAATLTRRSFATLWGAATGVAIAAPVPNAAAVDSFRALSATLTGFDESQLDRGFASELRRALLDAGHASNLAALAATAAAPTPETGALETDIISAWYSGVLPGTPPVVATLYGALVWSAADFATPPGVCAGGGGWSRAPAEAAQ